MNTFIQKIVNMIVQRKILSTVIFLVVLVSGYGMYRLIYPVSNIISYVTTTVAQGTIVSSVTATGQISLSSQVDVKSKAAGEVLAVAVKPGQEVKAGDTLVSLDASDAQKNLRDAEAALESAEIALRKLTEPADTLSLLQAQNALGSVEQSRDKANADLTKAYSDGFTDVSSAFLHISSTLTNLNNMLLYSANYSPYLTDSTIAPTAEQYKNSAVINLGKANDLIDKALTEYKVGRRDSATSTIETLIFDTYSATDALSLTLNSTRNLVDYVSKTINQSQNSSQSQINTDIASLTTWTGQINTDVANLSSIKNTIADSKNTLLNSVGSVAEKTESVHKLVNGPDMLDVQAAQLTVTQKRNAVQDAEEVLRDASAKAPIDGVVAKIDVVRGDSVSVGAVIATVISKQQIAELLLNEVDAAKVSVGQKATLTLDALPDMSLTGKVSEIDTLGTVNQGVVDYTVKIILDTQDHQIKSGMSVSAAIITDIHSDVLVVPNSAIKNQGNQSYVEMFTTPLPASSTQGGAPSSVPPEQKSVEGGLSNDDSTEIISGLKEGDQVVVKTVQSSTKTTTASTAPSLFGTGGNRGVGGGALRSVGR